MPNEDSLDNPTPAMLQVLARMKQRAKEAALANNSSNKRSKSERYNKSNINNKIKYPIRC